MDLTQINILVVLAAALSRFFLGAIWYGPLFKKAWMQGIGMTEEKIQNANMPKILGLSLLANIVIAACLGLFFAHEVTTMKGAVYGFLIGFGWVSMSLASNHLFEQRSLKLFAIHAGYHTLSFTIMGAIIAAWQ